MEAFVGICSSHTLGFPHTRGAVDRVRTCDLVLGRNELYQLSYYRLKWSVVADITPEVTTHIPLFAVPTGFEPVPRTVTGWNCNHSTTGPNYGEFRPKSFYSTKIWLYSDILRFNLLTYCGSSA